MKTLHLLAGLAVFGQSIAKQAPTLKPVVRQCESLEPTLMQLCYATADRTC